MADTSTLAKPGVFAGKLPPLVKRFYLQFALVLAFVIIVFGGVAKIWPDRSFGDKVVTLLVLAFFLTLACKLFAESRAWNNARYLVLSAGATALFAVPLFFGNTITFSWDYPTLPLLYAGIALLVLTAPFLRRDHANEALWEYNRATWSGVASGLAITLLVAVGLMVAMAAMDNLRGLGIPRSFFKDLYLIFLSFITAWLLLAGVPRRIDGTPADPSPEWLSRLANIVIVPVMAAGFAILLLYLVRLFAAPELPNSDIGRLIAGFAIFVVAAHFISWPLRETGGRAVRLFHRHYRYALLAPAIVLTLDAGMRVADSGLTEGRYLMLMLAFWLCATAIYHSLPTQRRLVMAPAMLAALLFAASFGPWGVTGLTTRLQLSQLENQLTAYELLVEGKVVPAEALIETEKMKSIAATLDFFEGKDKKKALEVWFSDHGFGQALFHLLSFSARTSDIMNSMGLQYISRGQDFPSFDFDFDAPFRDAFNVEGFSNIDRIYENSSEIDILPPEPATNFETDLNWKDGTFIVHSGGDERVVFDLAALAQRLRRENKSWTNKNWDDDPAEQLITLDGISESGRLTVRLHIHSISGHLVDGAPKVESVNVTVLWREN